MAITAKSRMVLGFMITDTAGVIVARQHVSELRYPHGRPTEEIESDPMLRTGLSPTGENPPTHYCCTKVLPANYWDKVQAYARTRGTPIEFLILANHNEYLQELGRQQSVRLENSWERARKTFEDRELVRRGLRRVFE